MKAIFRVCACFGAWAAPLLLLAPAAQAQRTADGAPAADPFGRRVVPARAVPGGQYRSHRVTGAGSAQPFTL